MLALTVVLSHMAYVSAIFDGRTHKALVITVPFAVSAVSGFFVLSGFVLTWAHDPTERARAFWRRRFWKIFPNHALAWALALVFFAITAATPPLILSTGHGSGPAIANLFLVQNWVPRAEWYLSMNATAWSISCEAFFYALFPALFLAARAIPTHRLRAAWAALTISTLLLPLVASTVRGPELYDWLPINESSLWFVYVLPPVRLPEFALGIVTARIVRNGAWPHLSRARVAAPAAVFLTLLPVLPPQYGMCSATAAPYALLIATLALSDIEGRTDRMARPALLALGEASYALYITHFPLLLAVRHLLGVDHTFTAWTGAPIVLALMAGAVGLSLVVYRFWERPLMHRWARPRPRRLPQLRTYPAPDPEAPQI